MLKKIYVYSISVVFLSFLTIIGELIRVQRENTDITFSLFTSDLLLLIPTLISLIAIFSILYYLFSKKNTEIKTTN